MIIRIFAVREPAKPLNDAQMCGSFLFLWVFLRDIYQSVPTFMDAGRDIAFGVISIRATMPVRMSRPWIKRHMELLQTTSHHPHFL